MISKTVFFVLTFAYVVECNTLVQPPRLPEKLPADFPPLWGPLGSSGGKGNTKECEHAVTIIGDRVSGDLLLSVQSVELPKKFFSKVTAQYTYPSNGSKNECTITQIKMQSVRKDCDCFKEKYNIVEGGVGKKHFKLNITSEKNCPIKHKVSCFTKC